MEDEEKKISRVPTTCERRIWKFYEWAVIFAPIMLMLSHWYIFYVFSQNNHELLHYSSANEICIIWIYTILYLYVPLMILPASYFFRWCSLFRIPFIYFIFINVERWHYGSWFCTNEMIDTHYILIYCIMCIYVVELIGLGIKYSKEIPEIVRKSAFSLLQRLKTLSNNRVAQKEKRKKILSILGEEEP